MTTTSSRYIRPEIAPPLYVTPRDRQVLGAVFEHRYLTAEHVHRLVFGGVGLRRAQERLRRLWSHRFLDRYFVPFVLDGERPPPRLASRPVYALARTGAQFIAGERGLSLAEIPHGFAHRSVGIPTLEHHLVVTDFLVALIVACRRRSDVAVESIDHEASLWRRVAARKEAAGYQEHFLVSDGAFTLHSPSSDQRATFHLEVVRADVEGGNERLADKMRRYVELSHAGYFGRVFGHTNVRAILFLTTSPERAENFRQLAARLLHGRRLFWFGSYGGKDERGREITTLTADTILTTRWQDAEGKPISFIPTTAPPRPIAASAEPTPSNVCATPPNAPGEAVAPAGG